MTAVDSVGLSKTVTPRGEAIAEGKCGSPYDD